jgi:cyclic beta-1,2-glucan synthetase
MTDNRTPPTARSTPKLSNALAEQEQFLLKAVRIFRESPAGAHQTSTAQWLLDNFYVVRQTQHQIRVDMPQEFYRRLPTIGAGRLRGYARIYCIARKLVVDNAGLLDADGIEQTARAIRSDADGPQPGDPPAALTIAELWALPVMLRLCMVQYLSQAACRVAGMTCEASLPPIPIPPWMKEDQVVANAILSLRALATQDWQTFFENASQVEHILRGDPAQAYTAMDRDTRDRYRKVVERLARATGKDEPEIARRAVALAQEAKDEQARTAGAGTESPRLTHIGYYLIDEGRPALETRLGYPVPPHVRMRRWVRHYPTQTYLGSITLISLTVLSAVLSFAARTGASPLQLMVIVLLSVVPALSVAVGLANWVVTLTLPPRILPKMDFEKGISAECPTLVVIPALLTSATEVNSLLKQIELHYLRNLDPYLSFALLTDLPDALQQSLPGDDALVEQAANGIRALNHRYPRERAAPFYLFHRERRWNADEARWMGWERKRGKLQELNRLLRQSTDTSYTVQIGDSSVLPSIKYVITLDADTMLLRQGAQRLVATLAHPLNQAEFNARGRVTAGYTLLQPRTEITPASASRSLFTRIFAGDVGLDLYTRAVSNVYQDLFGTGIYIGKGIYDVDALERSLKDRIPENALLSHDLFEGIHGRVGLVTDIVLYEDYPPHYLVYMRRSHRWIRGDWQLLPWLLPRVRYAGTGTLSNDLSVIDRWKILDNLRRSLLAPMLLLLFVASWLWLPGPTWAWTLFGILAPAVPLMAGAIGALTRNVVERNRSRSILAQHLSTPTRERAALAAGVGVHSLRDASRAERHSDHTGARRCHA